MFGICARLDARGYFLVDYAAGIRMRRHGRCNPRVAPNHSTNCAAATNRLAELGLAERNQSECPNQGRPCGEASVGKPYDPEAGNP